MSSASRLHLACFTFSFFQLFLLLSLLILLIYLSNYDYAHTMSCDDVIVLIANNNDDYGDDAH